MSSNDHVTFHGTLAGPHHPHHHHGGGGGGFRRDYPETVYLYPQATDSVDDEVAFHEAKHDVIIVARAGDESQIRSAVLNKLRGRGWVESVKNGLMLLSPPGLVAAMKGLGIIRGLGLIDQPVSIQPAEIMGAGVGAVMVIGGIVLEGTIGTILAILGGGAIFLSGGSFMLRTLSSSLQSGGAQGYPAQGTPPPPPLPPPKLTSQQRLQQSLTAYGPIAADLIKGIVSVF